MCVAENTLRGVSVELSAISGQQRRRTQRSFLEKVARPLFRQSPLYHLLSYACTYINPGAPFWQYQVLPGGSKHLPPVQRVYDGRGPGHARKHLTVWRHELRARVQRLKRERAIQPRRRDACRKCLIQHPVQPFRQHRAAFRAAQPRPVNIYGARGGNTRRCTQQRVAHGSGLSAGRRQAQPVSPLKLRYRRLPRAYLLCRRGRGALPGIGTAYAVQPAQPLPVHAQFAAGPQICRRRQQQRQNEQRGLFPQTITSAGTISQNKAPVNTFDKASAPCRKGCKYPYFPSQIHSASVTDTSYAVFSAAPSSLSFIYLRLCMRPSSLICVPTVHAAASRAFSPQHMHGR